MKRLLILTFVGIFLVGLAALSFAETWELTDVAPESRDSTPVITTANPDHCFTKISSHMPPTGYGVAEVWVNNVNVHTHTEEALANGTSAELESAGNVDLRSSAGAVFQGDVGPGTGTMDFVLIFPY